MRDEKRCGTCQRWLQSKRQCVLDGSLKSEIDGCGRWAPCGRKDDNGKPRYDLIAPEHLDGLARVLAFGAEKYSARNWESGMDWGRAYAAAQRHMWAWWNGESVDVETGLSHLHHAACCLMFLAAYEAREVGRDDRFPERAIEMEGE